MKILCNVQDCLWWKKLENSQRLNSGNVKDNDFAPLFEGECSREEIGVSAKIIETTNFNHSLGVCYCKSDKFISGHLDFTRFPQGGNIPDPVEPSGTFGV